MNFSTYLLIYIYMWGGILFLTLMVWKTQMIQFANKKILHKMISGKEISIKKEKTKTFVLPENSQTVTQCPVKRKKNTDGVTKAET